MTAAHGAANVDSFCAGLAGQQVSVSGSANGDTSVKVTVPSAPKLPALPALPGTADLPKLPSVPSQLKVPEISQLAGQL
ncbi:hypothetical protein [Arthrobacter sp. NPDC090010]|uniref:hypothetical protein n=1 Tax=Arthrobacter sp. NPDC090010 TaxID=3363942 RepID=UPI0038195DA3